MNDFEERVKKVISEHLEIDVGVISQESFLVDDLGADSLTNVELVLALEEEFDISINEWDADKFFQFKNVLYYIEEQFNARNREIVHSVDK